MGYKNSETLTELKHMTHYYHAHRVVVEKCDGHMTCIRRCPTQAIRIRKGKATQNQEMCVDCGNCISACQSGAVIPISDPVEEILKFKYRVAVPSTVLYSQFDFNIHPYVIHQALKKIGFDEVADVNISCEIMATALVKYMEDYRGRLPLISSHCPVIPRIVQVKYPALVDLVVPLDAPRELVAREAKKRFKQKSGAGPQEIGIAYIAPCPAKAVSIKQPVGRERSWFDVVISIRDIYRAILPHVLLLRDEFCESDVPPDFMFETGWATFGGVTKVVKHVNWLAVSGLEQVMKIFDDIENSRIRNVDFVEAVACMLGCFSGPYIIENPYVARANTMKQSAKYEKPITINHQDIGEKLEAGYYYLKNPLKPRPTKFFDTDLRTSIKRMREVERIFKKLRHIDCGVCGAPTCLAFAEDCARGDADLTDCVFFREREAT
jgi:iron only hydrogenase large subunit-like protein